jgi:mRNA-degrading endonuclease RelE of RelBE toxin-antitoxin system
MRYRFVFTQWFERNLRHLNRHNPRLRRDLTEFLQGLNAEANPIIAGTGGARKARMKVSGRGKSGGYRVIYYLFTEDRVWLLTVYDKVQKEDLSAAEEKRIHQLIQAIKQGEADQDSD